MVSGGRGFQNRGTEIPDTPHYRGIMNETKELFLRFRLVTLELVHPKPSPCIETSKTENKMSSWAQAGLGKRYLYDVLLDDVPLGEGGVLGRAPCAAQPCEGAAPGQREGAAERHLHGLPTRNLPPLPRLSLQTLDALQENSQWGSEESRAEPKRTRSHVIHARSSITNTRGWWLQRHTMVSSVVSQTPIRLKSFWTTSRIGSHSCLS